MELVIPDGPFAAYIFDCDGTLADTMPLHYRAWTAALEPLGAQFPEALFYSLGGVPAPRIIERLNAAQGLSLPPVETAEHKEALFAALLHEVQPIAPVVDFMRSVSGRFPLAVGSGGPKALVLQTLDALGIRDHFAAIVTYEDVVHGKPAPDTYLECARRLAVEPGRCLVFEDTPLGIEAATRAGMQSVFVPSGPQR